MTNGFGVTIEDPRRWVATMTLLGRVIVVTAVVATISSIVLVQRFATTYRDGLVVTEQSATLVAEAVGPVNSLADDLASLAATVVDGLELGQSLVDSTQAIAADIGDASTTNLAETAEAAADVADRLAQTLEQIERLIPGDRTSIGEELRAFADGLQPTADQLRTVGGELSAVADDLDGSQAALEQLSAQLDVIVDDIAELGPSFDAVSATAADLQARAAAASDRMSVDLWLIRILVLAVGAVLVSIGVISQRFAAALVVSTVDPV
ncbi:MAG: hypothetical protein WBM50_04530 [Acidimicrobiales bacterium]